MLDGFRFPPAVSPDVDDLSLSGRARKTASLRYLALNGWLSLATVAWPGSHPTRPAGARAGDALGPLYRHRRSPERGEPWERAAPRFGVILGW